MSKLQKLFDIDINKLKPVYLIYGQDRFLLNRLKEDFISRFVDEQVGGFNYTYLEETEDFVVRLKKMVNTPPVFSDKRFIIASTTNFFSKKNPGDQVLIKLLENFPPTAILLILLEGKVDNRLKVVESVKKVGQLESVVAPKFRQLDQWIKDEFKKRGKVIDGQAIKLLEEMFSNNLAILNSEIEKIITYTCPQGEITVQEVKEIMARDRYLEDNVIFSLTDALINRQQGKALLLLNQMLASGVVALTILGTITWQLKLLMSVKDLKEAGHDPATIARMLKSHQYPVKKSYQVSDLYAQEELELMLERFFQANLNIVSGKYEAGRALEMAILG